VSSIPLRPYQIEACAAVEAAWREGLRRSLVTMATGLGKTIVFSEMIRRTNGRALVLAHRDELLEQAAAKIRLVCPSASIGFVRRQQNELDCDVVLASVQTIAREKRLASFPKDFSIIVVDEAHHAVAPEHRRILEHTGALSDNAAAPFLLGVTATPHRADKISLAEIFQKTVFKLSIMDGIIGGYLCDLRVQAIRLDLSKLKSKNSKNRDFSDSLLGEALMAAQAPERIVAAYLRAARGRRALCFTPTIEVARAVSASFNSAGVSSEWLCGETPPKERRAILERLRSGETQAVANAGVLTEGFDEPSLGAIIVARPTQSKSLYIQMVGRGTRTAPSHGKKDCIVLDVVGANEIQSDAKQIVTLADITGLPAAALASMSVLEAVSHYHALMTAQETEAVSMPAVPVREIEKPPPLLLAPVKPLKQFAWVRLEGDFKRIYALSLGQGCFLYVVPVSKDVFDVMRYDPAQPEAARGMMESVAENLPLDYAMGRAEDIVRDTPSMPLVTARAGWRASPASVKQIELLKEIRLFAKDTLTKGEAADLITGHIAGATLERILREGRAAAARASTAPLHAA